MELGRACSLAFIEFVPSHPTLRHPVGLLSGLNPDAEEAVVDEVSPEERKRRAVEMMSNRVLTPADFEKIKQLQVRVQPGCPSLGLCCGAPHCEVVI